MKCPLSFRLTTDEKSVLKVEAMDCLKEGCAWWRDDIQMCAIKDWSLELSYTQQRLADLTEKMPERKR